MNEDIKIKLLSRKDVGLFKELITLFQHVFEHKDGVLPSNFYLEALLSRSDFVVYVAIHNKKVVAGLTAYEIRKYYSEVSEFFLYDIAVSSAYQRQGIGKVLLESIEKSRGETEVNEMFVAAHEEDMEAIKFYKSTGGKSERVIHFNYYIRKN